MHSRWTALVARHPSLGPWLERQRAAGRSDGELQRALRQFEQLSPLDLTVVARSLDDEQRPSAEALGRLGDAAQRLERSADARTPSPEEAAELRSVFERHPAMAQARRCVEEVLLPALQRARPAAVPLQLLLEHLRDACLGELADFTPRLAIGVLLNLMLAGQPPLIDRDTSLLLKVTRARSTREAAGVRAALQRLPPEWGLAHSPAFALGLAAAEAHRALEEAVTQLSTFNFQLSTRF